VDNFCLVDIISAQVCKLYPTIDVILSDT